MGRTELHQRLAAILAADVAGYSRLMAIDERATVAALDAARQVFRSTIESNQGRVVDMAGDSVLAVFETAAGAVSTALAVQQQLEAQSAGLPAERRMRFRIGVHLGDVIEKRDGTVYGDGVNIAARLEGLAEPGGITVSDAVRGAVGNRLAVRFDDQGEQQVKNIAEPVRAFHIRSATSAAARGAAGPARWAAAPRAFARRWGAAVAVALALAALVSWALVTQPWATLPSARSPHALSVAVMPFGAGDARSADVAIADALGDSVATALGQWRSAKVTGPGLTAAYKGQAVDARRIGRDLNVRYVVEGELRAQGSGKLTVSVRLIETDTATQPWSERFEMAESATTEQQSRLQMRLASRLQKALKRAGTDRAAGQAELAAPIDFVLRGDSVVEGGLAGIRAARAWYDKALRLDPEFVPAITGKVWTLDSEYHLDVRPKAQVLAEMDALSARAVAIDPRDDDAWSVRSTTLAWNGRWGEALAANEKAIALAPYLPAHVSTRGMLMLLSGRQAEAETLLLRAVDMDPPGSSNEFRHLCFARLLMGRYDEALPDCERSAALDQSFFEDQMLLAALYAHKGDSAKAAIARNELLKQQPGMTIANSLWARVSDVPEFRRQLDAHAHSGLRKAGIPER